MTIRVLASDLDGTLLASGGRLSPTTARVLRQVVRQGVIVAVLTARPARLLGAVQRLGSLAHYAACDNGAVTCDLRRGRQISIRPWPPDALNATLGLARSIVPSIAVAVETPAGTIAEPRFAELAGGQIDATATRIGTIPPPRSPATKLMAITAEGSPERLCCDLARAVPTGCTPTHSGSTYVELCAPGATKATALAALCARLQIASSDVVAFGDMPNDIDMLRWAGVGVAVANAHPDVLEAADIVAASNDDDGVATHMRRLLANTPHPRVRTTDPTLSNRRATPGRRAAAPSSPPISRPSEMPDTSRSSVPPTCRDTESRQGDEPSPDCSRESPRTLAQPPSRSR